MKAVQLTATSEMKVVEIEKPFMGPDDVLGIS